MLFLKECKKIICSLIFVLYTAALIIMYASQLGTEREPVVKPQAGQEDYGMVEREVPEILMPAAIESLKNEYESESYIAYPFLLYKEVKLNEADTEKIAEVIAKLSVDMPYDEFRELMRQADKIIGGGSKYCDEFIVGNFSMVPETYEEALKDYEETIEEGNIGESYTRLYCDYLGITLAILPVFLCVFLWQLDRNSQMEELIYSRKLSSFKIVGIRYLALVSCMMIPVILTFLHIMAGVIGLYPGQDIGILKAIGIGALWLIPEIMIVAGVGILISETVSPLPAIFVQGIWWYTCLVKNQLTGSITKWTLIVRHNNLGKTELFRKQFADFLFNRTAYAVLALICLGLTVFVYEKKRKGVYGQNGFIWKNHVRKSEA